MRGMLCRRTFGACGTANTLAVRDGCGGVRGAVAAGSAATIWAAAMAGAQTGAAAGASLGDGSAGGTAALVRPWPGFLCCAMRLAAWGSQHASFSAVVNMFLRKGSWGEGAH